MFEFMLGKKFEEMLVKKESMKKEMKQNYFTFD